MRSGLYPRLTKGFDVAGLRTAKALLDTLDKQVCSRRSSAGCKPITHH